MLFVLCFRTLPNSLLYEMFILFQMVSVAHPTGRRVRLWRCTRGDTRLLQIEAPAARSLGNDRSPLDFGGYDVLHPQIATRFANSQRTAI